MVKNFLVVVMMEHGSGPNEVTVMNMKTWKKKKYVIVFLGAGVIYQIRPKK